MFELKDCVLEVTSAKHHVRMELLNVWKGSLQVYKSAFWQGTEMTLLYIPFLTAEEHSL